MGTHDDYGKKVMRTAFGSAYSDCGPSVLVTFGEGGGRGQIDGTIGPDIAVEIESRVPKQIRGAVLDLICHPFPKKVLILLPVHMGCTQTAVAQAHFIFRKFLPPETFRVILLSGSGNLSALDADVAVLKAGIVGLSK